jgi:UMF1 family MFS transporter
VFGIVSALVGAIGTWFGGRLDSGFGPRPVIAGAILALIAVCTVALTTSRGAVVLIQVGAGSALPDLVFYACGGLLGAAGGTLQAASRTMLVRVAEGRVPMTQAFGLYALSGKATAFIAPLLIGLATTATGSQALGVSPVIGLFAIGLALLYWVKTPREA